MFLSIFSFELKQSFRKPSFYIYFSVFFALTLLIGLAASGFFNTTRSDSNTTINSATMVAGILLGTSSSLFGLIGNVMLISFMATAIQKDYEYNTHPLFFTKPITKAQYFFGRFLSSFFVSILVFSGLLIGYYLGSLAGLGTSYVGEFKFVNFIQPFLIFTLPNVFLLGVIFFSLSTYLRNTSVAYVVAIVLMVLQIATSTISSDIENKNLAALLEPTGSRSLGLLIEYWSPVEQNEKLIPFAGVLLQNRLLWVGVALLITAISYYGFSFSQFLQPPLSLFKRKDKEATLPSLQLNSLSELPKVSQTFTLKNSLLQIWQLGVFEFKKISKSLFFIVMAVLAVGTILLVVRFMDSMYDSPTHMVTYKIIESAVGSVGMYSLIFILFYSGTIIWRDRTTKMVELVGSTPVSNATLFFSKFIGLVLAFVAIKLLGCLVGIIIQLKDGFYNINLLQYLFFIVERTVAGAVLIAFCLSVQVYSPNKFLGFFIVLLPIIIIPIIFDLLEWDLFLFEFNSEGRGQGYSDMNGYGFTYVQWPFYRIYWTSIAAFLSLIAIVLYARGKEKSIVGRFRLSKFFINKQYAFYIIASVLLIGCSASYLFYEERVVQESISPKEREKRTADFEKKYKKYQHLKQPRIIATTVQVDLFTKSKQLYVNGIYTLKNNNATPIDSLYVEFIGGKKTSYTYAKLAPNVNFKEVLTDKENGIKILKLNKPLLPNDSLLFEFDMSYKPRSYFDKVNSPIVANGTFISNDFFPTFGYNSDGELSQNNARKEYGLQPKERMAAISDSAARMNNYISKNADWIKFEATISTDEGQIAIAPGYLQKEWKKDGRHYFRYKMDSPILNFYSFLSAAYSIKKDVWNGINLEIYYQQGHEYNLERMMKGMKKSLDYYTKNFGPYQHRQVRIIEFPNYSSFAQSFPNTIPFSESIGFIMKVNDKDPLSIDVPFYVTAHEVAHQWWAHQVIGADVQGSVLMSETMSQYSALMVMEKEYGKDAMKKFLKYEMDRYLQGRTFENKKEMPLMLVENQQYINYNKGSVVMYALKDYIGEDKLNGAIREYLNKVKFQQPPYTIATEFVETIFKATPDSLKYLVTDMFGKITLYENYVKKLDYKKINDKTYKVNLTVGCAKFYADEKGKLSKATIADYVDLGIFTAQTINGKEVEKPLLFTRVKMDKQEQSFEYTVTEKPVSAGIDPYLKLIDRTPANNTCKFGKEPAKPNLDTKETKLRIAIGGEE